MQQEAAGIREGKSCNYAENTGQSRKDSFVVKSKQSVKEKLRWTDAALSRKQVFASAPT